VSWLRLIPLLGNLIDPIGKIADTIAKVQLEKASAITERAKILANEKISVLEKRRQVLVLDPYGSLVRFAFAAPFILYDAKLVVWDKVLGLGSTDSLSIELQTLNAMVLGFYFLHVYLRKN